MTDKPQQHASHWPSWPSLILGSITIFTLFQQLATPPVSTDLWWHLVLGKQILDSGSPVIDHSLFTWSHATAYHVYNTWLGEVILYLVDHFSGKAGLMTLRYLVYLGIGWLGWRYARQHSIHRHPLTWVIIFLALEIMVSSSELKPELFTLGFMTLTVWLYYHIRSLGERALYLPYLFPLIILVWVNTHGAFFIVSLFMSAVLVGDVLNERFSPQQAMPRKLQRHFLAGLLLCLPAMLVNPYGLELPLHIIHAVLNADIVGTDRILAYRPTSNFNGPPFFLLDYLIVIMLLFVLLVWQKLKQRHTDWVVILSFIGYAALFVQMGRVTYFLGPVFLFAALDLLAYNDRSWLWPSQSRLKHGVAVVCAALLLILAGRVLQIYECRFRHPVDFLANLTDNSDITVVNEADYIEKHLPGRLIGNVYQDGGYLMYRFWPEKRVMIDPRAFPFREWINDYFRFIQDGQGAEAFTRRFPANFWLIRYNKPLAFRWFLDSSQWEIAFLGPLGAIFVPAAEKPENVILSPAIDTLDNLSVISRALVLALDLKDLGFAKRLQAAAETNMDPLCGNNKTFIRETKEIVTGFTLFRDGNYLEAADWLSKPKEFFHSERMATNALMILASRHRAKGEHDKARKLIIRAFDILPSQELTDFYNLMVAEWHYTHSQTDSINGNRAEGTWAQLASFLLGKEKELSEANRFILDVAMAMKDGSYDGNAKFIVDGKPYSEDPDQEHHDEEGQTPTKEY